MVGPRVSRFGSDQCPIGDFKPIKHGLTRGKGGCLLNTARAERKYDCLFGRQM